MMGHRPVVSGQMGWAGRTRLGTAGLDQPTDRGNVTTSQHYYVADLLSATIRHRNATRGADLLSATIRHRNATRGALLRHT